MAVIARANAKFRIIEFTFRYRLEYETAGQKFLSARVPPPYRAITSNLAQKPAVPVERGERRFLPGNSRKTPFPPERAKWPRIATLQRLFLSEHEANRFCQFAPRAARILDIEPQDFAWGTEQIGPRHMARSYLCEQSAAGIAHDRKGRAGLLRQLACQLRI